MVENQDHSADPDAPDEEQEELLRIPDLDSAEDLVEVYATDNDLAAGLIIDEILAPAGIPAYPHDRRSHAIPAPAAMPGEIGIAVPSALASRAKALLREARRDGVLSDGGGALREGGETEQA
ncbi:MAG: hypothetical protein RMK29_06415 [Myxococcales bacterium]|nr:hypothetical protein [Myxococcota bacterium]MDW8281326.1 hypothetical protein [Myxococcales bacterium]